MKLGYIGLGKMGRNMVERLLEQRHEIVVYDTDEKTMKDVTWQGAVKAQSVWNVIEMLERPRFIWIMVPHQVVDTVLSEIVPRLHGGDIVIDGGNSFYKDTQRRAAELTKREINFMDVGVSGGPRGAREGACLMIGGNQELYKKYEELFQDISAKDAYGYFGESGAGHFVKMIHNGIEYGMMQSLAEGFEVLKKAPFPLSLTKIANIYNHKSVVESRLVGWLEDGYKEYGEDLEAVSGSVAQSGEGMWTAETAEELGVPAPIIKGAVEFRKQSKANPSYTGKVLSTMRNQFGGHKASAK
jgi:6-phosphogluconate dehydrogenase